MTETHEVATYRVVALKDGMFGVEVVIPGTFSTLSAFASEVDAELWIARHTKLGRVVN